MSNENKSNFHQEKELKRQEEGKNKIEENERSRGRHLGNVIRPSSQMSEIRRETALLKFIGQSRLKSYSQQVKKNFNFKQPEFDQNTWKKVQEEKQKRIDTKANQAPVQLPVYKQQSKLKSLAKKLFSTITRTSKTPAPPKAPTK